MSTFYTHDLPCPRCQAIQQVRLADSLNASRHPAGRAQVLDRTFHRHVCQGCGHTTVYDRPLLYTELDRGLFVRVEPETLRPLYATFEAETAQVHHRALLGEHVPAAVREELGVRSPPRLVFGYEELREKVLGAEHGLDDFIVEALKFELLASVPGLMLNGALVLTLDAVDASGLELTVLYDPAVEPRSERVPAFHIPRSSYEELARLRGRLELEWPELAASVWMNIARYRFRTEREDAVAAARGGQGP